VEALICTTLGAILLKVSAPTLLLFLNATSMILLLSSAISPAFLFPPSPLEIVDTELFPELSRLGLASSSKL
jgi:hypothetical protein